MRKCVKPELPRRQLQSTTTTYIHSVLPFSRETNKSLTTLFLSLRIFLGITHQNLLYWVIFVVTFIYKILSFDVSDEAFYFLPLPMLQKVPLFVQVWVMDDYVCSVKGCCSLIKKLTIVPLDRVAYPLRFYQDELREKAINAWRNPNFFTGFGLWNPDFWSPEVWENANEEDISRSHNSLCVPMCMPRGHGQTTFISHMLMSKNGAWVLGF